MVVFPPTTHINTRYPSFLNRTCPFCNSRVRFTYPGRKRNIVDFQGSYTETRYFYCCTNKSCFNHSHPFNPSPSYTLPNKKYSSSVWKWIGRECRSYNMNASKIYKRIQEEYGINITENTIRNICDEIDSYLVYKIDEETKKQVQVQGKILISLDGQKPEDGEDALWLFVDLISNRVFKVELLASADHMTLKKCIEDIEKEYEVEIIGFLSDKQGSIVKMCKSYYPDVPHQYCQFHFLQNLWNYIEAKDSSLQKQLSTMINHLRITTISVKVNIILPNVGIVNFREYFRSIESDLRKLIKNRNKKFEKLRGTRSYERIKNYCIELSDVCGQQDPNHRVTKILKNTASKLENSLMEQSSSYTACIELVANFKQIRDKLNNIFDNSQKHTAALSIIFENIWENIRLNRQPFTSLRAKLPQKNMSLITIKEQWYRLFKSYLPGLFRYYEFPVVERTNAKMEQQFGQEKQKFIQRSGKPNVSRQIRMRGASELKIQYAKSNEIKEYLNSLEGSYSINRG